MNDVCKTKHLRKVEVQENGIIRNEKGRIIARLIDDVDFNSEHLSTEISNAMDALREEMRADCPEEPGSYAHSWHCIIAMTCYNAMVESARKTEDLFNHDDAHRIGNDAATRFMKLCFGVETKA